MGKTLKILSPELAIKFKTAQQNASQLPLGTYLMF